MNGFMKNCYCDMGLVRLNGFQASTALHGAPFDMPSFVSTQFAGVIYIASGVLTIVGGYHRVDTEGGVGSSDDLDTINGGADGRILVLHPNVTGRTIVAKDGTGNLHLAGNFTMDNEQDTLTLIYDGQLAKWLELSRSDNGV
jgi:hypothetical protein